MLSLGEVRERHLALVIQRSEWVDHLYEGFDVLAEAERAGDAEGASTMLEEIDEFVMGLRELEDHIANLAQLLDPIASA